MFYYWVILTKTFTNLLNHSDLVRSIFVTSDRDSNSGQSAGWEEKKSCVLWLSVLWAALSCNHISLLLLLLLFLVVLLVWQPTNLMLPSQCSFGSCFQFTPDILELWLAAPAQVWRCECQIFISIFPHNFPSGPAVAPAGDADAVEQTVRQLRPVSWCLSPDLVTPLRPHLYHGHTHINLSGQFYYY